MSFETYNVTFSGQIMKDHDPAEVRKKVGAMFKLEGAKLDALFSGDPVTVKKAVDMEQAVKFRVAFREVGALVDIRPVEKPKAEADTSTASASTKAAAETLTLSAPGSYDLSDCTPAVQPQPIPDISALALDKPGGTLDEEIPPDPIEIDISELELEKPGGTLDENSPPDPIEIDTSELELEKPGVILDEAEPPPSSTRETPDLGLSQPNEGSLEEYQQPTPPLPIPNIDHLELEARVKRPSGRAEFDISEE